MQLKLDRVWQTVCRRVRGGAMKWILGQILTIAVIGAAYGSDDTPMIHVYRCDGADGVPSYVSKPVAGVNCALIASRYLLDDRWQFVSRAANESFVSYDKESMIRDGDKVSIWVQTHNGEGDERRTLSRDTFDCPGRTVSTSAVAGYRVDGSVTRSSTYLQPTIPAPIAPGTINEIIWRQICRAP